jgi:transcriptional regulator GlxA family with amidase domain
MSPRNFARLFRSGTGMTPGKFVEQARVEAARCKLEQSDILETIAASCGFGTPERMRRPFSGFCMSARRITARGSTLHSANNSVVIP